MFCSNCGTPLDDKVKFCPNCGTPNPAYTGAVSEPAAPVEDAPEVKTDTTSYSGPDFGTDTGSYAGSTDSIPGFSDPLPDTASNAAGADTAGYGSTGSFDAGSTGSYNAGNTGSFDAGSTGSYNAGNTGSFNAGSTGGFSPDQFGQGQNNQGQFNPNQFNQNQFNQNQFGQNPANRYPGPGGNFDNNQGRKKSKAPLIIVGIVAAIVALILIVVAALSLAGGSKEDVNSNPHPAISTPAPSDTSSSEEDWSTTSSSEETEETEETSDSSEAVSSSDLDAAVEAAQNELDWMAYSRLGIIDYLVETEGFSKSTATEAVDSMNIDWQKMAAQCAKEYLDAMPMSYQELQEQLVYEQFSEEDATYGVDNCDVDWDGQDGLDMAVRAANEMIDADSSYTKDDVANHLSSNYYTDEQVEYAIKNCDGSWNK